jgi:Zn-dependent M28 family amino/carboxypeptidase
VRNIEAAIGSGAGIVIGAHYDTVPGSPGADDNASAVAALIELAGLLRREPLPAGRSVRLVAFANEEPPYFMSGEMGSYAWAKRARERAEPVLAMFSLEMLGYYRDAPGSQGFPFPLGFFYPDRADFVAFVGDLGSRDLVRRALAAWRAAVPFPSQGVAAPALIPGVTWSDHWSFRSHGFPAIMLTDTAFYRYPHYHLPSDTPDKLDYERLARVTLGLAAMLRELAARLP